MKLVYGCDGDVAQWVADRVPHMTGTFGACAAIGIVAEDGTPLGGVVFHNWIPEYEAIEISFATVTSRCLTRNLIRGLLSYPFDQLKCYRLTAVTPKKAASARRFLDTFGFKREGSHRRALGRHGDALSYRLLKPEWEASRWVRKAGDPHGQVSADPAARS